MNANTWNPMNLRGRGNRRPFNYRGRAMGRPPWHQGPPRPGMSWVSGFNNPYNRSKYQQNYFMQRAPAPVPARVQLPPPKPPSPLPGSEEYIQRNIQQASDLIKRQLNLDGKSEEDTNNVPIDMFEEEKNEEENNGGINNNSVTSIDSNSDQNFKKAKVTKANKTKPIEQLDVTEIHDKIIKHISSLSYSKKINLVNNTGMAAYDTAIEQIQKQKRLELSRALRDLSNKSSNECSGDVINAIIPDFDIKFEDLSREVISKLSSTLDTDISKTLVDPEECFKQAHHLLNNEFGEDIDLNLVEDIVNLEDVDKVNVGENTLLNISDPFDFEYFNKPSEESIPIKSEINYTANSEESNLFLTDFNPNRSYLSQPTSAQDKEVNKSTSFNIKVRTDLQAKNPSDHTFDNLNPDRNEHTTGKNFNVYDEKLSVQICAQKELFQFSNSPSLISPASSMTIVPSERSFVQNCESSQSLLILDSSTENSAASKIPGVQTLTSPIQSLFTSRQEDFTSDDIFIKDFNHSIELASTKDLSTDNLLNIPVAWAGKKTSSSQNNESLTTIVNNPCSLGVDHSYEMPQGNTPNFANLDPHQQSNNLGKEYEQFMSEITPINNIFSTHSIEPLNKNQLAEKELYSPDQVFNQTSDSTDQTKKNKTSLHKANVETWLKNSEFSLEKEKTFIEASNVNFSSNKMAQAAQDNRKDDKAVEKHDKRSSLDENKSRRKVDIVRDKVRQDHKRRRSGEDEKSKLEPPQDNLNSVERKNIDQCRRDEDRFKKENKLNKEDSRYTQFKRAVESNPRTDDKVRTPEERSKSRDERYRFHEQKYKNFDERQKCRDEKPKHSSEIKRSQEDKDKGRDGKRFEDKLKSLGNETRPDYNRHVNEGDKIMDEMRNKRDCKYKSNSPQKPVNKPALEKETRSNHLQKDPSRDKSLDKNRENANFDRKSSNLERSPPRDRKLDKNRKRSLSSDRSNRGRDKTDYKERNDRELHKVNKTDEIYKKNDKDNRSIGKIESGLKDTKKKFVIPKIDAKSKNDRDKPTLNSLQSSLKKSKDKDYLAEDTLVCSADKKNNVRDEKKTTKTIETSDNKSQTKNKTTANQEKESKNLKNREENIALDLENIIETKKVDIHDDNRSRLSTTTTTISTKKTVNVSNNKELKSGGVGDGKNKNKHSEDVQYSKEDKKCTDENKGEVKLPREKDNFKESKNESFDVNKKDSLNNVTKEINETSSKNNYNASKNIITDNSPNLSSNLHTVQQDGNKNITHENALAEITTKIEVVETDTSRETLLQEIENIQHEKSTETTENQFEYESSTISLGNTSSSLELNVKEEKDISYDTEIIGETTNVSEVKTPGKRKKKSNIESATVIEETDVQEDSIKHENPTIKNELIEESAQNQITEEMNTPTLQSDIQSLVDKSPNKHGGKEPCQPDNRRITRKSKRFKTENLKKPALGSQPKITDESFRLKPIENNTDSLHDTSGAESTTQEGQIEEQTILPKKLTRNQKKLMDVANKLGKDSLQDTSENPKPKRFRKGVNVIQNIKLKSNPTFIKKVWKSAGEKKLLPFDLPLIQETSLSATDNEPETNTVVELKFEAEECKITKEELVENEEKCVSPKVLESAGSSYTMFVKNEEQIEGSENTFAFKVEEETNVEPAQENIVNNKKETDNAVSKTRSGINRSKSNARPKSKQKKNLLSDNVPTKRKLDESIEEHVPNKVIRFDVNIPAKYSTLISVETQTEPVIIENNINNLDVSNMRNTIQYLQTVDEQIESLLKLRKNIYKKLVLNIDDNSSKCSDDNISSERRKSTGKVNGEIKKEQTESQDIPMESTETVRPQPDTKSNDTSNPTKNEPIFKGVRKKPVKIPLKRSTRKKKVIEFSSIDECIDTVVKHFSEDLQDLGFPKPPDLEVSNPDTDVESTCSSVLSTNKQLSIKLPRYDIEQLEALRQNISKPKTQSIKKEYKLEDYDEFESLVSTGLHSKPHENDDEVVAIDNNLLDSDTKTVPLRDINFGNWTGSILVIKVINKTVLAANDKGVLYFYDLMDGELKHSLNLGTKPLTSLVLNCIREDVILHVGSLDGHIYKVNYSNRELLKSIPVQDPIQCMESAWGYIFLGSHKGNLIRYHVQKEAVEDENIISPTSVLVIRATQEGARRVLLVATRNSAVTVRDAMSGLLLRTLEGTLNPTVYTLLFYNNHIYCGTSQHDVLVYTFQDGQLMFKHEQSNTSGVVCMSIVKNLLFVGCYNGNIYVYNTSTNDFITSMSGPGGLFLSMEVTRNMVFAGTKQNHFKAWVLPQIILDQMSG